jgi:hypothetical protein
MRSPTRSKARSRAAWSSAGATIQLRQPAVGAAGLGPGIVSGPSLRQDEAGSDGWVLVDQSRPSWRAHGALTRGFRRPRGRHQPGNTIPGRASPARVVPFSGTADSSPELRTAAAGARPPLLAINQVPGSVPCHGNVPLSLVNAASSRAPSASVLSRTMLVSVGTATKRRLGWLGLQAGA